MQYSLEFPELSWIKSHPRVDPNNKGRYKEYAWTLFDIGGSNYVRITYNEDNNNKLFLDIMSGGYCDRWREYGFNCSYPATKTGYAQLQNAANNFVNKLMHTITNSNEEYAEEWTKNANEYFGII